MIFKIWFCSRTYNPWRWRRYLPLKRRDMLNYLLQNVTPQAWPLKMGLIYCPETSANKYQRSCVATQKSEDLVYTAVEARNLADSSTRRLLERQISQSEVTLYTVLWERWRESDHHCFVRTLWIMNVRVGPVYWKLQLAGWTTHEQAVSGGPNAATQGEVPASRNFHQSGHRTTDEKQLYLQYILVCFVGRLSGFSWPGTVDPNAVECGLHSSVI